MVQTEPKCTGREPHRAVLALMQVPSPKTTFEAIVAASSGTQAGSHRGLHCVGHGNKNTTEGGPARVRALASARCGPVM
eukprot:3478049-Prymnesium_polylepis.1